MHLLVAALLLVPALAVLAAHPTDAAQDPKPNPAITPVARTDDWVLEWQAECLRRAKTAGPTDVVFVGDSITQSWEETGKPVWERHFAGFTTMNLGVSGDRTEHVLWRLNEAPLDQAKPKVIVLLIGTNNLGHGTSNAEQALEGVLAVLALLRAQAPQATLLVCETFPRGERFNKVRGDILQVNQAVRGQLDAKSKSLAIGDRWVRKDGTIDKADLHDFLHLSESAYDQWAQALLPEIRAALR